MESMNIHLKDKLLKLSTQFECFGLPAINIHVDVIDQLINNATGLIHLHRESLSKQQEFKSHDSQLQGKLHWERKNLDNLRQHIQHLEKDVKKQINSSVALQSEIHALKSILHKHKQELKCLKLYIKNREAEWSNKVCQQHAKLGTEDHCTKLMQRYHCIDKKLVRAIAQGKLKEDIYHDTILQLQANNAKLQDIILNLKDEVMRMLTESGQYSGSLDSNIK